MKKILFSLALMVLACPAFAVTDVNETAQKVIYGAVSVSTSTYVDMSSNTITNVFAYNICNESAAGGSDIRCGYDVNVSTVSGNAYQGFPVRPTECEYRAVTNAIVIYCKAEGSAAINTTREIFGKAQY